MKIKVKVKNCEIEVEYPAEHLSLIAPTSKLETINFMCVKALMLSAEQENGCWTGDFDGHKKE